MNIRISLAAVSTGALLSSSFLVAQPPGRQRERPPVVVSPEVKADRTVVFRIHAPKAQNVSLFTSDLPGGPQRPAFKKDDKGVWEMTLGPVEPGTFRYLLSVDDVRVVDPRNQAVSQSNGNVWSVLHVPGAAFMDEAEVPHGAVAAV